MVESLNTQSLKHELKDLVSKDELKGLRSLKLFEKWLENVLQISQFSDVSLPFYVLYDFRILSSHLISKSKRKETLRSINKRLDLLKENENYEVIYDTLINRLRESYEIILAQI